MTSPNDRRPWSFRRTTLCCAIALTFLSLTFVRGSRNVIYDWGSSSVEAHRLTAGVPLPWISRTWWEWKGDKPILYSFMYAGEWQEGIRVDPPSLFWSLVSILLVAALVASVGRCAWRRMARQSASPTLGSVLAVALSAALTGSIVPTKPTWHGLLLLMALIIVIALATIRRPHIVTVVWHVVLAMSTLWWVQRMSSYFWTRMSTIEGFSWRDDLVAPVTFMIGMSLIVLSFHFILKKIAGTPLRSEERTLPT